MLAERPRRAGIRPGRLAQKHRRIDEDDADGATANRRDGAARGAPVAKMLAAGSPLHSMSHPKHRV